MSSLCFGSFGLCLLVLWILRFVSIGLLLASLICLIVNFACWLRCFVSLFGDLCFSGLLCLGVLV